MDLTIQQLRGVVAVADHGSFTAAALALHLTQSSLSRAVSDVERRAGVRLFERTTRRVEVTDEGRELVRLASHLVATFDAGMQHFQGFLDGRHGTLRVAALPSLAATLLPPVLSSYREGHPEVAITVNDGLLGQVIDQVREGSVDLAVTVCPDELAGLHFIPVTADRFFLVCAPAHRFADRRHVAWRELGGEPFIGFHETSSVRHYVDGALARAGVRVGPTAEARNVAAVAGLVAAGLGITAVPALVLPLLEFAQLRHIPLTEPVVERSIGVVLDPLRPQSRVARDLVELLTRSRAARL